MSRPGSVTGSGFEPRCLVSTVRAPPHMLVVGVLGVCVCVCVQCREVGCGVWALSLADEVLMSYQLPRMSVGVSAAQCCLQPIFLSIFPE